jgi:hypothetical protein
MEQLCHQLPSLMPHATRIVSRLNDVRELAEFRHTIIHGYFHGISSGDEPQIYFRRTPPLSGEAGNRVLASRGELESIIERMRKVDEELMVVMMAAVSTRKRPRPNGPLLP